MPTGRPEAGLSWLDVAAFADELLLLAVLALGGASVPVAVAPRAVLATMLPVAAAIVWALLLAPRASRRLTGAVGLSARVAVFTLAGGLLAVTASLPWAIAFWALSTGLWSFIDLSAWSRRLHTGR